MVDLRDERIVYSDTIFCVGSYANLGRNIYDTGKNKTNKTYPDCREMKIR